MSHEDWHGCADCKHWGTEMDPYGPDGWRTCGLSYSSAYKPRTVGSLAIGADSEMYQAWMITAPRFHCNQWEKK